MSKTDESIERIALNAAITQEIIKNLVADIEDRRGLKSEWNAIEDDVKDQIIQTWSFIILSALRVRD